jgi:hypothetical protein
LFLRRKVADPKGSSKLDELAVGPYLVVKSEGHTLVLRICEDDLRVSKNRVTRAPRPLAEVPIERNNPAVDPLNNVADPTGNDSPEFVIDKIAGLRKADDGTWSSKVRWYGYSVADDTWEPADHLPGKMVRRYHRRVGLPLNN